jgi:hypothetical protein
VRQSAGGINQVSAQIFDYDKSPEVARLLLNHGGIAERDVIVVPERHVAVKHEFGFQVLLELPAPPHFQQKSTHGFTYLARTRCTAREEPIPNCLLLGHRLLSPFCDFVVLRRAIVLRHTPSGSDGPV